MTCPTCSGDKCTGKCPKEPKGTPMAVKNEKPHTEIIALLEEERTKHVAQDGG